MTHIAASAEGPEAAARARPKKLHGQGIAGKELAQARSIFVVPGTPFANRYYRRGSLTVDAREVQPSALRPTTGRMCLVMACADMSEADQVGRELLELNLGCLVTYRRSEDLVYNTPVRKVALVILAANEAPAVTRRMLKWLRNRWPRCPVAVVGETGGGEEERTAREGGALYLTRPVAPEHWSALLAHVLGSPRQAQPAEILGSPSAAPDGGG
jgi:hypothetical protein